MKIWRCDLTKENVPLMDEFLSLTRDIIASGRYILSTRLEEFEKNFAEYCGMSYCVGVASGTEAIYLSLMALEIRSGDEVIIPAFTAIPTLSAVLMTGATPRLVDIDPQTYNMDPSLIESAITKNTKVILPVHLFGLMADMEAILEIARKHGLSVIEDAAQSHGSLYKGKKSGHYSLIGCYSFYPTKNLGALGDAGAVVTNDETYYHKLRLLRNYGQESLYHTVIHGVNSRLDELQAAYLNLKLRYLDLWNAKRRKLAELYRTHLPTDRIILPVEPEGYITNYHIYVIRAQQRDALQAYLEEKGIQTNIYYPLPLHLQKSNTAFGYKLGDFPVAEKTCKEVLALPMYPELEPQSVEYICQMIRDFYTKG